MRRLIQLLVLVWLAGIAPAAFAVGARVKDIAVVAGARDNQLVGYGLVVGLAGGVLPAIHAARLSIVDGLRAS